MSPLLLARATERKRSTVEGGRRSRNTTWRVGEKRQTRSKTDREEARAQVRSGKERQNVKGLLLQQGSSRYATW